ncbi:Cyclin N-terminal domain-containing protein 1 [Amphibalanus amphitrite]|uniref:Cyclin N-terminal domain-containing protein 1 n=1 Tax=Amphibalanus amphitrite TaxID=1232801 RepID=A0A6A4VMU9_AMPAM|nr:Cyclin N-terminal domain-containing protein 1 [Amphibalanus amphitrite]KAF0295906.1 Cyclin N-terminal domain-containing protein 1 [Amphibalanus amphitrite]KAF0295907.1 Cyclin N-terminal domain-containing protein 1 [Amphibalanus amphitrite]
MADPAQSSADGATQYSLDHSKLIDDSALDVLLLEWGQTLRQPAALPADDLLAHYGVFGAPETGHLLLYFTRRLGQPPSVFFRALQLFERFMETHMAEMHQYIVTKVERDSRQKEWKNLLERIRSQAILRMLSCIQISSKLALHYKILTTKRVKSLLREVKHCYSLESVVNSEVRILKTLKYKWRDNWPQSFFNTIFGSTLPLPIPGEDREAAVSVHKMMAGHWGRLLKYLHRIGHLPSTVCLQCPDKRCHAALCALFREEADVSDHVLLRCPALAGARL